MMLFLTHKPDLLIADLGLFDGGGKEFIKQLRLKGSEYELLKYFLLNINKTLTHKQILKEVWGVGYQNEMQYLRTYANTLRKKIEENSTRPAYIRTESGIGYRDSLATRI